jgi:hypothetical protein
MPDPAHRDMYVGYLPVPPAHRRFLRWAVPTMLWILCLAMFLWTRSQQSPGTGVWDQGQPIRLHGTLLAHPYPMLMTEGPGGAPEAVLLVEVGKVGAAHNAAGLHGRAVTASGWPLHRDGRRMLELEPDEAALTSDPTASARPWPSVSLGRATLRGEIVDSKCFLGAMKPGEGKTHKECATLCIKGGIPPMLVMYDGAGRATYNLLAGPDGGVLEPAAHPFIGDVVEVSGELFEQGGIRILRCSAASIRRL